MHVFTCHPCVIIAPISQVQSLHTFGIFHFLVKRKVANIKKHSTKILERVGVVVLLHYQPSSGIILASLVIWVRNVLNNWSECIFCNSSIAMNTIANLCFCSQGELGKQSGLLSNLRGDHHLARGGCWGSKVEQDRRISFRVKLYGLALAMRRGFNTKSSITSDE